MKHCIISCERKNNLYLCNSNLFYISFNITESPARESRTFFNFNSFECSLINIQIISIYKLYQLQEMAIFINQFR